ncbi:hypothetical protein NHX12_012064, partial [Muraenolepis orangiensis]
MKRPVMKLTQEVDTRWNSTFLMLQRLFKERQSVEAVLAMLKTDSRDGEGRGGGVGIQHTTSYRGEQIRFVNITTFEYVAVVLEKDEWEVPVLLVNVYFPPGYSRGEFNNFLSDFEMLLSDINVMYDHVIFTGDFNIHMDENREPYTIEFNDMLKKFDLKQHVNTKTHNRGHTLDLVFTRNVDVSNLT